MKKITLILSFFALFVVATVSAQTTPCNNTLSVTISGVSNSTSCTAPCNGQATANATGATSYLWSDGQQAATATGLCAGTYTVYALDNMFNCGSATVTITCPTSVHENSSENSISIFPNPVSEELHIKLYFGKSTVSVFNSLGEKVAEQLFDGYENSSGTISTENLPKGVYYVKMINEGNVYSTKFIVQ